MTITKTKGGFTITRPACIVCGEPPFGDEYACGHSQTTTEDRKGTMSDSKKLRTPSGKFPRDDYPGGSLKSKAVIQKMLSHIEAEAPMESRGFLIMALEWVLEAPVSTSQDLETYIEESRD